MQTPLFEYPNPAPRPQILLLGNGLEHKSGQKSWNKLLDSLKADPALTIPEDVKNSIPFPLLYQLLAARLPMPAQLSTEDIKQEEDRLAKAMQMMIHSSNEHLDRLPGLDVDHILTTNYSYCIEKAFYPKADFGSSRVRGQKRFYLAKKPGTNEPFRERDYRLHTGYLAKSVNRQTGIWHIHGECFTPKGIVLGHDRYGRLLQRIADICASQKYNKTEREAPTKRYTSWPELFLHGDVYVLGLGLETNELDLRWLIRRKQRERYATGRIYYYEREPVDGFTRPKHLLMQANGIRLCSAGCTEAVAFDAFYQAALDEIARRVREARA